MNRLLFGVTRAAGVVWQTEWRIFLKLWPSRLAWTFVEPLLYILAFGVGFGAMVPVIDGRPYLQFIAPGVIMGYVMYTACFECTYNTYNAIEHKLYEAMLTSPLSAEDVMGGVILWGATRGGIIAIGVLGVLAAFGIVSSLWAVAILPVALLLGVCFAALGVCVTSLVKSYDHFNYLWGVYIAPAFLFSGIFYPLDTLPQWARQASWVFPTTYAVIPSRHLLSGSPRLSDLLFCLALLLIGWALSGTAIALMRRRLMV